MKVVIQHDIRDCGAACIKMIAAHYKLKLPFSKCRELTKTDKMGTNIYGLIDGANKIGLSGTALYGTSEELIEDISQKKIEFPFIAHIISDNGLLHFVVITAFRNGKFIVADPAKGKLRLKRESFFERWTGNIVTFEKKEEFRPGNYTKGSFRRFFSLLKGQYSKLTGVLILSLVISVIGILGAFVFQLVIDNFGFYTEEYQVEDDHEHEVGEACEECVTEEGGAELYEEVNTPIEKILEHVAEFAESSNFRVIFIAVILFYILQMFIQFLRGYLIMSVSRKIDIRLILGYYNRIVELPVSSVSAWQTGEYLSRFSEASAIREAVSGATLTLILDSLMVVASGVILYLQNVKLFWISFLVTLLYAIILLIYRKPVEKSYREVMENDAALQSYFKESIDGIETVKAAGAEQPIKQKTTSKFTRFINSVFRANLISLSQEVLADTVELIGTVIILWIGFVMVLSGDIKLGALMTFYVLLEYFSFPIKNLIQLQPEIQTALVAADRLNDILDLQPENLTDGSEELSKIKSWELKNVDFRYGNRELVLKNIDMSIRRGERIAIVGESGSGKTTIAKLLLRFYEAEKGTIRIGDRLIREVDLVELRKSIAYVDQDTFMFCDTVKNNLKLGNPLATDDEIKEVCQICHAEKFIESLPLGYDTLLDENGTNLSGGQKQRLAIARALLKKPQLLILDEATSNLDTITEMGIKDTVFGFSEEMTCIIIAHRLTTILGCDRIYVMDEGMVIEEGTHEELMRKKGKYAALWNRV